MKLWIAVTSEREIDAEGPWPREEEFTHIFSQYNQVEFYAEDDDTAATNVFEVTNAYDCYWLIVAALQFKTTTDITVELPK